MYPKLRTAMRSFLVVMLAVAVTAALSACSTRNDPGYNPYARPGGAASWLQCADALIDQAAERLDNFDSRMENALY